MNKSIKLYGMIISLKNRLELNSESGNDYSAKQIQDAIYKINQLNGILDRRGKK